MAHAKITPDIEGVLQRSSIEGTTLKLPEGQLDRKLYQSVAKTLENAGGKWNRSAQGFVFAGPPGEALGLMLETGLSRDKKKDFQSFLTPRDLASRVVELAEVGGHLVLEPSAGEGALVAECLAQGARAVECIEIREECRQKLIGHGRMVMIADFMDQLPRKQFARIVMNPPFTKKQDVKHLAHALTFLDSGGILVAILSATADYEKVLRGRRCSVHEVPAGAFKESGTNVATIILKVQN